MSVNIHEYTLWFHDVETFSILLAIVRGIQVSLVNFLKMCVGEILSIQNAGKDAYDLADIEIYIHEKNRSW